MTITTDLIDKLNAQIAKLQQDLPEPGIVHAIFHRKLGQKAKIRLKLYVLEAIAQELASQQPDGSKSLQNTFFLELITEIAAGSFRNISSCSKAFKGNIEHIRAKHHRDLGLMQEYFINHVLEKNSETKTLLIGFDQLFLDQKRLEFYRVEALSNAFLGIEYRDNHLVAYCLFTIMLNEQKNYSEALHSLVHYFNQNNSDFLEQFKPKEKDCLVLEQHYRNLPDTKKITKIFNDFYSENNAKLPSELTAEEIEKISEQLSRTYNASSFDYDHFHCQVLMTNQALTNTQSVPPVPNNATQPTASATF